MSDLEDRNDRTLFVGNLERSCQETILYELFMQAGPLNGVKIAKERDGGGSKGFAFIEFKHEVSVPYALNLLKGTSLFGRQLSLNYRKGSKHEQNPYQGPPRQAFPKGFPEPFAHNGPPNIQRTFPQLPNPIAQFDPTQGPLVQTDGYRGSPVPDLYGSPMSQGSPQSFPGSYGQQTYNDSRPSSQGPGSRDQSQRWEGHNRGERHRGEYFNEHQRGTERLQEQRNKPFERSESHAGHHSREERHHQRGNERHHRSRERSRTVDDHQRGLNGGQHYRERSAEDFHRRNTGFRSNDGYRHQHHR